MGRSLDDLTAPELREAVEEAQEDWNWGKSETEICAHLRQTLGLSEEAARKLVYALSVEGFDR